MSTDETGLQRLARLAKDFGPCICWSGEPCRAFVDPGEIDCALCGHSDGCVAVLANTEASGD